MRKVLSASVVSLLVFAIATVGVSAFESHVVNVTAQVSNSMTVTPKDGITTLGTLASPASPLRWRNIELVIALSSSFTGQSRVNTVNYKVCAAPKEATFGDGVVTSQPFHPTTQLTGWKFLWMGGASFLEMDHPPPNNIGPFRWIGPTADHIIPTASPPVVCPEFAEGTLITGGNDSHTIYLWEDVPAFAANWTGSPPIRNVLADCGSKDDIEPCVLIPTNLADPAVGVQLGLDLIIQVIDIQ